MTSPLQVSELPFDDEAMNLIVFGLAREVHEFALGRNIPSHSIESQLPLVLGELDDKLGDLLDIRDIPAGDTSCLAGLRIGFSDEGYRRIANAAKDRVADTVDGDGNV